MYYDIIQYRKGENMVTDINDVLQAIEKYNNAPQQTINKNLKRYLGVYRAEKLVEITGMKRSTVFSWAKTEGGNKPTFESALKICRALNISIDDLVTEHKEEKRLCSVKGCENEAASGKDMCIKCYEIQKKRGRLNNVSLWG
jgi:DNA-binding Xre family transcriptional regulator